MMPCLEHVCLQIRAAFYKLSLGRGTGVACKHEAVIAVCHFQTYRIVVRIVVLSHRPEKIDPALSQLRCIPRFRSCRRDPIFVDRTLQACVDAFIIPVHHEYPVYVYCRDHRFPGTDMILVRMRENYVFQVIYSLIRKISGYERCIISVARIDEHRFSIRHQQSGIRLPYIEKMYRELSICRNRPGTAAWI